MACWSYRSSSSCVNEWVHGMWAHKAVKSGACQLLAVWLFNYSGLWCLCVENNRGYEGTSVIGSLRGINGMWCEHAHSNSRGIFFFFAVSVLGMDSQLLVYSHTRILNVREGRVLEAEGREMFEKSLKGKKLVFLPIICRANHKLIILLYTRSIVSTCS